MFALTSAGINAFDVHTRRGAFCGVIVQHKAGYWRVFFNMTATRGSRCRFETAEAAIKYIRDRRICKGWGI